MNINKQLLNIILEQHDGYDKDYPANKYDTKHATKTVSQIKQSILKAIMEKSQEIEQDYFEGEGCDAYDGYDIGFDNCKREFESVIKEVLGGKE